MFFDDPVAAFANLATAMWPGGRLCLATWQPLAANDWLLVPGAALLRYGSLPDAGDTAPGMFAQSDPITATQVLEAAGFLDVTVDAATVSLRLGSDAADATDYLADTGIARAVLDTIDPADRVEAIVAVTDALATHADAHGVRLAAGINLIRASR